MQNESQNNASCKMQKGTKRYSIQEPNKKLKLNCKSGLILITNKTIDKKSSHNPYTQDYARFFV